MSNKLSKVLSLNLPLALMPLTPLMLALMPLMVLAAGRRLLLTAFFAGRVACGLTGAIAAIICGLTAGVAYANDADTKLGIFDSHQSGSRLGVIEALPMGHDDRFKVFPFVPNSVYKVIALYDSPTYVEFEGDETIVSIMPSKAVAWQLTPQSNKLYLKPIDSDANMTLAITTSKREYFFEMYAFEPESGFDKRYTFRYQFQYPAEGQTISIKKYAKSIVPDVDKSPEKYNFYYTIIGEPSLYPVKIFDDGEFTYFEFPKSGRVPAIFSVDTNQFESILNFRVVGNFVAVEEISPRFTLRHGPDVVCVYNESLYTSLQVSMRSKKNMESRSAVGSPINPDIPPARKRIAPSPSTRAKMPALFNSQEAARPQDNQEGTNTFGMPEFLRQQK